MIITYYGLQFFKLQRGDLTIAVNPISRQSGPPAGGNAVRFGADIALVSINHADFNGVENISYGEKTPFIINGPGEYEIKGISIRGFPVKTKYEEKGQRINTIYWLSLDGIDLCFLGALDSSTVSEEILEAINNVDILFVPAGKGILSPSDAYKASLLFEPGIVIPVHYEQSSLKKFLEEAGAEDVKAIPKLVLKKKDMEGKEGEIIVLKSVS